MSDVTAANAAATADDLGPWTERRTTELRGYPAIVARRIGGGGGGAGGPGTSTGLTMVLCHSVALDHTMWEPLVSALPPDIDVLAYDVRNHGPQTAPPTQFSLTRCADDLRDLVDELGLGPIYPVGISMGGAVVQEFAARHAGLVAGLALMASSGRGGPAAADRAAAGERDGLDAQVDTTLSRWFSPDFLARNGPWVRYARDRITGWTIPAWAQAWRALGDRDMFPRLPAITAPALCIAGDSDASAPVAAVQAVADALPHAALAVLPGPHLLAIEAPEAVAGTLAEHYRRI